MLRPTTTLAILVLASTLPASAQTVTDLSRWKQHDMNRPRPPRLQVKAQPSAPAPSDAVVLFGGRDIGSWQAGDGGPAKWIVRDGYMEVVPGSGSIQTKEQFGDAHLHVEWAAANPPSGTGQNRSNSGVFLMGRYEVQVLDSYDNDTYPDGQAAAIYGQFPPLWNVSLPSGEWQAYDIFFRRPKFGTDGRVLAPARMTVLHNGVLVQNNESLTGITSWLVQAGYRSHGDAGPIGLQDHGAPVRFRNIWVRRLPERPSRSERPVQRPTLTAIQLGQLAGDYRHTSESRRVIVRAANGRLALELVGGATLDLLPVTSRKFEAVVTDASVEFTGDRQGRPTALIFTLGGEATTYQAER